MHNTLNSLLDNFKMMYFMNAGNINGNNNSINYNFLCFFFTFVTFVINNDACYEKTNKYLMNLNLFYYYTKT